MRRRALVKKWLPVVAPLLVLGSCETKARAEGFYWGLRYSTSLPVGSVRTFVPDVAPVGFDLDARYWFSNNLSIGVDGAWNRFSNKLDFGTYPISNGAITATIYRYVEVAAVMPELHYYFQPRARGRSFRRGGGGVLDGVVQDAGERPRFPTEKTRIHVRARGGYPHPVRPRSRGAASSLYRRTTLRIQYVGHRHRPDPCGQYVVHRSSAGGARLLTIPPPQPLVSVSPLGPGVPCLGRCFDDRCFGRCVDGGLCFGIGRCVDGGLCFGVARFGRGVGAGLGGSVDGGLARVDAGIICRSFGTRAT